MVLILTGGYAQRKREGEREIERERNREKQRETERERERERESEREEAVDHIVSACPTIVNAEYLRKYTTTSPRKHRSNNSMGLQYKYRKKYRSKLTRHYNKKFRRAYMHHDRCYSSSR